MAFTTRALAEMAHIGTALGGRALTFFGLAGVGDLFLTCSSQQSRNHQLGHGLAQGKKIPDLLKSLGTVEGLWTAQVAQKLCRRHKLRTPVIDVIVPILQGKMTPQQAQPKLMQRQARYEF
jgi:glycerol-3-phosphate dehydrogenase (NAD(P)+)